MDAQDVGLGEAVYLLLQGASSPEQPDRATRLIPTVIP